MRAILLAMLFAGIACTARNTVINRVINPYIDKAFINPEWQNRDLSPDEWYYRSTVIDAPPNTKAAAIGDGHWLHPDLIRWEITEKYLMGWRSTAAVIGAEGDAAPGATEGFRGDPVLMFAITSHFEPATDFDTTTFETLNLITESDAGKSWRERRFMRVDWRNLIASETDNKDVVQNDDPSNPNRLRVEKNYFELTTKQAIAADKDAVAGKYGNAFRGDSAAPIISTRHSFLKKQANFDYIPLNYSDNMWKKFGFYRTGLSGRETWSPVEGSLETNELKRITRFNIWQRNRDDKGKEIPIGLRTPKPIIYYTSVYHPDSLMRASRRVEFEWNQAMKELVFYAQPGRYVSLSAVPDMWILRVNDCNAANIAAVLQKLPASKLTEVNESTTVRIDDVKRRIDRANDPTTGSFTQRHNLEVQAKTDLEKLCSALEFYTSGTNEPFVYQRSGDLRVNLLNPLVGYHLTNWSGFSPMFADPISGQMIQGNANVNLLYIDKKAAAASDQIDALNGDIGLAQLVYGNDPDGEMPFLYPSSNQALPADILSRAPWRSARLTAISRESVLEQFNRLDSKLQRPELNDLHINGLHAKNYFLQKQDRAEAAKILRDPPELIDNMASGLALKYKELSRADRFAKIREDIYTALMLHQIGHNMGLTDNTAASSDALNYSDKFWSLQQQNSNLDQLSQLESMYSSVMDFNVIWDSSFSGLGKYDKAALKFGYAQLVEVFPKNNLRADASKGSLANWIFLNDWKKIPAELLASVNSIRDRQHMTYQRIDIENEVPYKFCMDVDGFNGPHCKAFDFGPDMQSQASWINKRYWQHYYFTHFSKGRLWTNADLRAVINADLSTFDDYNTIMRWGYYYGATRPEFAGSDAEKDFLAASIAGLNHYTHVLSQPVSGIHVTTPRYLVENYLPADPSANRLATSTILIPYDSLDTCDAENIVVTSKNGSPIKAKEGFTLTNVPLGFGRPLMAGHSTSYEDQYPTYAGTYFSKLNAGLFLGTPGYDFPGLDTDIVPGFYAVSWYKLFPKEVGQIFFQLMTDNSAALGPILLNGHISLPNAIDLNTLAAPNYSGALRILPAMSPTITRKAAVYGATLLSSGESGQTDMAKKMRIGDGSRSYDNKIVQFIHPIKTNDIYVAPQDSEGTFVGAAILDKLNGLKTTYEALDECVQDPAKRSSPICMCVVTQDEASNSCVPAQLKTVGQSTRCTVDQLKGRRRAALDQLNQLVSYVKEIQDLVSQYESRPN